MPETNKTETLAILVTYGQDFRQCSSWLSLRAATGIQVDWFVADNNPEAIQHGEQLEYRHYPHNPGVSQAYLAGATYAREHGYRWLLLLDQDTHFPLESWQAYQAARDKWPGYVLYSPQLWSGKLGISPAPIYFGRTFASKNLPTGPYTIAAYNPINAGMLVALDAYLAVGGHEPTVYLDFSDFAFLRKFKQLHKHAVAVPFSVQHGLSGTETRTLEQDYVRFSHYCRCMKAFARLGGPWFWLYFWTIIRAVMLSIRHKSIHFFGLILSAKPKP